MNFLEMTAASFWITIGSIAIIASKIANAITKYAQKQAAQIIKECEAKELYSLLSKKKR